MQINRYMDTIFPNLELKPPLFYSWKIGIRFKLGVNYNPNHVYENCPYLLGVYERAITLFNALYSSDDDMVIVIDVEDFAEDETVKRKLNILSKYVKEKSVLFRLIQHSIPYLKLEDDEDGVYPTRRFLLNCKPTEIRYIQMIKAICNQDMGIKPSLYHRVYFINKSKNTIFHIYDDRGCDLLAASTETIRGIYNQYNEWILDYDRNQIDKVFNENGHFK